MPRKPPSSGVKFGGELPDRYIPPVLFPHLGQYMQYADKRQYTYDRIVELAEADDLCLTEMLAQTSRIRNMCGCVIFGIARDPMSEREERAEPLPPSVLGMGVRLIVIDGRAATVKFKRGVTVDPTRRIVLGAIGGSASDITSRGDYGVGSDPRSIGGYVEKRVDEVWDFETTDATLDLSDAWICLSKHGEHCFRVPLLKRMNKWLYREVDADGDPMINRREKRAAQPEPEAKRGPGRPRKTLS